MNFPTTLYATFVDVSGTCPGFAGLTIPLIYQNPITNITDTGSNGTSGCNTPSGARGGLVRDNLRRIVQDDDLRSALLQDWFHRRRLRCGVRSTQ